MSIKTNTNSWGTRAQIGAALLDQADLKTGNKDRVWNEKPNSASWFDRQPVGAQLSAIQAAGLSLEDAIGQLAGARAEQEAKWGMPAMDPKIQGRLKDGQLFATHKAQELTRLGRTPDTVLDGFAHAAGGVDGVKIAPREIFHQIFLPTAPPTGHVIVALPGFGETSQDYTQWAADMNAKGHAVIVADQQWAGHTEGGRPGQVDRGFGITRDAAVMASVAEQYRAENYGDKSGKVVMFGQSMGGGLGVLGLALLAENDRVQLEGRTLPKDNLRFVAQAPFLSPTPSAINSTLIAASSIPLLNRIPLPPVGVPDFTDDRRAESLVSQGAVLGDVKVTFSAFKSVRADGEKIRSLYDKGAKLPMGKVSIVHAEGDTLADPANSRLIAKKLGIEPVWVPGTNHALTQSTAENAYATKVIDQLLA